jgi:hypothetical protein
MNRRQFLPILGLPLLLLTGCSNTYNLFFRMTVEVDDDGQVYSGSSVMKLSIRQGSPALQHIGGGASSGLQGEAVALEIGKRGLLFMALRKPAGAFTELPSSIMRRARVAPVDPSSRDSEKRFEREYRR